MISKEDARALLDSAGRELKALSYEEFHELDARLPASPHDEWREWRRTMVGDTELHFHVLIGEWGLRRRISVEIALCSEEGSISPANIGSVYFERFRHGKLVEPSLHIWHFVVAGVVLVALISAAVLL